MKTCSYDYPICAIIGFENTNVAAEADTGMIKCKKNQGWTWVDDSDTSASSEQSTKSRRSASDSIKSSKSESASKSKSATESSSPKSPEAILLPLECSGVVCACALVGGRSKIVAT